MPEAYFFSFLPNFKLKLGKKQKNIFFFFPNLKLGKNEKKTLKLGKKIKIRRPPYLGPGGQKIKLIALVCWIIHQ